MSIAMMEQISDEMIFVVLNELMNIYMRFIMIVSMFYMHVRENLSTAQHTRVQGLYSLLSRIPKQINKLREITGVDDVTCHNFLRMNKGTLSILCNLLEVTGDFRSTRNCTLAEMVAQFLFVLAHHEKQRRVSGGYKRSSRTVSRNVHRVLTTVLKLYSLLLAQPVPIDEHCTDNRLKCFKGCLGALDGTNIEVTIPMADQGRYHDCNDKYTVNMLGVCEFELNFIYVLSGWKGSANDSRVLRNANFRDPEFRVPHGNYYLCDGGYANREDYLAPYRDICYHLKEWAMGVWAPRNKEEYFNMKHAKARNIIK